MNGRKRFRSIDTWKRKRMKQLKDSGKEYKSCYTNKDVRERVIGPPCTCKQACFDKIGGMQNVSKIFISFWNIGEYNKQTAYLQKFISRKEVSRSRVKDKIGRRKNTLKYSVMVNDVEYKVCKIAFMSIHGVSKKRLSFAIKQISTICFVIVDIN